MADIIPFPQKKPEPGFESLLDKFAALHPLEQIELVLSAAATVALIVKTNLETKEK